VPQAHRPTETEETNAPESQEQPVVKRDVNWKISHVVELQDVMIDDPLYQVKQSPTKYKEAGKRTWCREQTTSAGIQEELIDAQ